MKALNVGVLPVVEEGKEAGMITDRDIITRVIAEELNPAHTSVGEVMTKQVISCTEETDIGEAARIMETNKIRRLLVKNEAGRLTGVVSLGDIAVHATRNVSAEILKEVSEPSAPSR
jgi:CBS domain-containing protein